MKKRLSCILSLLLIAVLVLAGCTGGSTSDAGAGAAAQTADPTPTAGDSADYPTKPITLLCGFSAGGSSDLLCRILSENLTKELGQPVTVVNKEGGGGFVAWNDLVRSTDADGYTFALINTPHLPLGRYDEANPRDFDHNDMDVLVNHVTDYNVIACRTNDDRYSDFESFLTYARENEVIAGTSALGIMSDDDTIINRMNNELGTKIEVVITTGAKDNEVYLFNKSADILVGNVSDVLTGKNNGDFTVMCVFAPERVSLMADVPTCYELGYGEIVGSSSRGYALPQGVEPEIRATLLEALEKAILSDECRQALEDIGAVTNFIDNDAYGAFLDEAVQIAMDVYSLESMQ